MYFEYLLKRHLLFHIIEKCFMYMYFKGMHIHQDFYHILNIY